VCLRVGRGFEHSVRPALRPAGLVADKAMVLIDPDDPAIAINVVAFNTTNRAEHHVNATAETNVPAGKMHGKWNCMCRTSADSVNVRSTSHSQAPF